MVALAEPVIEETEKTTDEPVEVIPQPDNILNQIRNESIQAGHDKWFSELISNYNSDNRVFSLIDDRTSTPRKSTNLIPFDVLSFMQDEFKDFNDDQSFQSSKNAFQGKFKTVLEASLNNLNLQGERVQKYVQDTMLVISNANFVDLKTWAASIQNLKDQNINWADSAERIYKLAITKDNPEFFLMSLHSALLDFSASKTPADAIFNLSKSKELLELVVSTHRGWRIDRNMKIKREEEKEEEVVVETYEGVIDEQPQLLEYVPIGFASYSQHPAYLIARERLSKVFAQTSSGKRDIMQEIEEIRKYLQLQPTVPSDVTFRFVLDIAEAMDLSIKLDLKNGITQDILNAFMSSDVLSDPKPIIIEIILQKLGYNNTSSFDQKI